MVPATHPVGYVSNKYARVVTVVDAERMETVGSIQLPEAAWGGQGIYVLPDNEYRQARRWRGAR